MKRQTKVPTALTIAGSDSGGGAGIQADLKTFAALGVHGTTAVTCLTAQNPRRVSRIEAVSPAMVRAQIAAVFEELPPMAVKTGMLHSAPVIQAVLRELERQPECPLVVDPVMVATSGARLLRADAARMLLDRLIPRATLVTPNLDEAAILVGGAIEDVEGAREAAHTIHERYGCAALVKGGHLRGLRVAADFFYDGRRELLLESPYVRGVSTHGTGCTYAAAVTAYLAQGCSVAQAVERAKGYIARAIAGSVPVARHTALGFFRRRGQRWTGSLVNAR